MIDFRPSETPLRVPVLNSFQVRDKVYVVDMQGFLFQLQTDNDDPEFWNWQLVLEL